MTPEDETAIYTAHMLLMSMTEFQAANLHRVLDERKNVSPRAAMFCGPVVEVHHVSPYAAALDVI